MKRVLMMLLVTGICALGAAEAAVAQDREEAAIVPVAGVWDLTMETEAGSFHWIVTFEQEGTGLTGFVDSNGSVFDLEGSVEGHELRFRVAVPHHAEPVEFDGAVDGDSASGEVLLDGRASWHAERVDG